MTAVMPETSTPVLHVAGGLTGFPDDEDYALVEVADAAPLLLLNSVSQDGPQFVVVPPAPFFPDYAPEIDDAAVQRLGLRDASDALLLVILTVGAAVGATTANLLAPLVVNRRSHRAAQVVLTEDWPLQAVLPVG